MVICYRRRSVPLWDSHSTRPLTSVRWRISPIESVAPTDQLHEITTGSLIVVLILLVPFGWLEGDRCSGSGAAATAAAAIAVVHLMPYYVCPRPDLTDQGQPARHLSKWSYLDALTCAFALIVVCPRPWRGAICILAGSYAW
jgi:hypothetical protein